MQSFKKLMKQETSGVGVGVPKQNNNNQKENKVTKPGPATNPPPKEQTKSNICALQ